MAHIPSLATDLLEPPNLGSSPPFPLVDVLHVVEDVGLPGGAPLLGVVLDPLAALGVALQERAVRLGDPALHVGAGHELGLAPHRPEQPVAVRARLPVQAPPLRVALDPARHRLVDVDVRHGVGGRRRRRRRRQVLLHVEGHGREPDRLARHPAHALEGEGGLCGVREGFVLFRREEITPLVRKICVMTGQNGGCRR